MKNFRNDREDRGSGGWGGPKKFGSKPSWNRGGDDRRNDDREMFKATCSECGDMCQVPFRPRDGRPVFCSNCFKKDGDTGNSFDRRSNDRPSFRDKPARDFSFRDDRRDDRAPERSRGDNSGDLKAISMKLDSILKVLSTLTPPAKTHVVKQEGTIKPEPKPSEEAPKKVAKKKVAAKKKK